MNGKIVVKIDGKTCALTIILAFAFSVLIAFGMYKLIMLFYNAGLSSCSIAKYMFVVYPIIFLSVAFTFAGYLMIIGNVEEESKVKKILKKRGKRK